MASTAGGSRAVFRSRVDTPVKTTSESIESFAAELL